MAAALTLRRSNLPDAGPDDWTVWIEEEDGKKTTVGRIYKTPNRVQDPWFWGLTRFPSSAGNSGFAGDLEEAKMKFRERWEKVR